MEMYRHYGTDRIDMDRKYTTSRGDKPAGLWASPVSCGDPWKEWCEDEDYEIEKLDRHFDFTLKPGARILHVREKEDAAPYIRSLLGGLIQELDHESLQRDFDGMELHLSDNWSLRDMNVFYYWNVDSIVIWGLDVIEPLKKTLTFKDGDLVKDKEIGVFAHQTNCFGVMGAGIAAQIAKTYPNVAEADRRYCHEKDPYGTILCVPTEDRRICINMYSQYSYGRDRRQTDYTTFRICLQKIEEYLQTVTETVKIGFPDHIGCGLAGGDWNEILPMLEDFAARVSQPVVIVRYAPEKEA